MTVSYTPRSNILAYVERTSSTAALGPANTDITSMSITFTPDERPYGIKLWLPDLLKDATPGAVQAFVQIGAQPYGSGRVTIPASSEAQLLVDVPPGAPSLAGIVVPGVPVTWKASLTNGAGAVTVVGGSGLGAARPWLIAYTDR